MDRKKILFLWDFARYLALFLIFYPLFGAAEIDANRMVGSVLEIGISELLTNDGHVWGDFVWILSGIDLRGQIWLFSMLAVVVLDYFWAFRGSVLAKKLRVANWVLALGVYAGYTVFFPTSPRYDYFIYAYVLSQAGLSLMLALAVIASIAMMWLGVILIDGFLIYRSLDGEKNERGRIIPVLMSLGIPGSGHIAVKKYREGFLFLLIAALVWLAGFYLYFAFPLVSFVPVLLFWVYVAYRLHKQFRAQ